MVECEFIRKRMTAQIFLVLIDTWWNVNINFSGKMAQMSTGFNRYMVECEYSMKGLRMKRRKSFNRYMVECELIMIQTLNVLIHVLIDTWWNVNNHTRC